VLNLYVTDVSRYLIRDVVSLLNRGIVDVNDIFEKNKV